MTSPAFLRYETVHHLEQVSCLIALFLLSILFLLSPTQKTGNKQKLMALQLKQLTNKLKKW